MSDSVQRLIEAVTPQPGYRLAVTWRGGERAVIDFSGDVGGGGIWAELRDVAKFSKARIGDNGAVLEWPEPAGLDGEPRIDVDADGLYAMGLEQRARPLTERASHLVLGNAGPT